MKKKGMNHHSKLFDNSIISPMNRKKEKKNHDSMNLS
jgi:hypothetical protein